MAKLDTVVKRLKELAPHGMTDEELIIRATNLLLLYEQIIFKPPQKETPDSKDS